MNLAQRNDQFNHILDHLRELREVDAIPLAKLAYQLGATEEQVKHALGVSKETVNNRYNRKELMKGGENS